MKQTNLNEIIESNVKSLQDLDVKSIEKVVSDLGYQANDLKANQISYANLPACCKIGGMDKM